MYRSSIPMSLLLAAALAAPAAAQNTAGSGTVTESGRPIDGATVLVDGDTANALTTDQDGMFSSTFAAGAHKFKVALHGYQPVEQAVTVTKDKAVVVDFALTPVLQIMALSVPASLKQGTAGKAVLVVKNTASSAYSLDEASLSFLAADGTSRGADFTVQPDAANLTSIKAGDTATLSFTVTPAATAAAGKVTVRASLFTFDTAMGSNLLPNGSFEAGDATSADGWVFGGDNTDLLPGFSGSIATDTAITGARSIQIKVPEQQPGDDRAYWGPSSWIAVTPGATYVLSGYVKTQNVASGTNFGAAVYVPVPPADAYYQQPNAPWVTGTRDWRKERVVFTVSGAANNPQAVPRGTIQQGTGTAWFDNISLTEGTDDGSLTVTGGDQTLAVTQ